MTANLCKNIDTSDEKGKEMKSFAIMSYFEGLRNYSNIKQNKTDLQLAKFLHDNNLSEEEQRCFVAKCLTPIEIKKILLKYELDNYKPPAQDCNLKQFAKIAMNLLNRYQSKAGGFDFEDVDWTMHDKSSSDYKLKKEDVWFENSVNKMYRDDEDTLNFLDKMKDMLASINPKIKVAYEIHGDKNTCVVFIKCEKESKKEETKEKGKKGKKGKKNKKK
jgi:hypothetical protein